MKKCVSNFIDWMTHVDEWNAFQAQSYVDYASYRATGRVALSKLFREGGAGAEGAILPYVGHLQLISTLKIGADCR